MSDLSYDIRIEAGRRSLVSLRDFRLPRNRLTFLFGESGIGKSLTARAIYGLLDPDEFNVTVNGERYNDYLRKPETRELKRNSFFVFQEPSSHLNPLLPLGVQLREGSLAESVGESALLKELWGGQDEHKIEQILSVYPKPYRPSGGEKQRMFLAMALKKIDIMTRAKGTDEHTLFVFDEPTGSLDNYFRDVFLSLLLKKFQRYRFTTLLITHDYSMVSVVTRYHHLIDDMSFKELSLDAGRLELKEFRPEVYLNWLEEQRKEPTRKPPPSRSTPLLRVESGAEVFGQRLTMSRDRHGREATPLEVVPGTIVYLKAPSGTGKTTLVKMVMGLIRGRRLRCMLDGTELTERTKRRFWQRYIWGRKMTMVFQHADEALNPRSTVAEAFLGLPSPKRITREDVRRALDELFDVGAGRDFLDKKVETLSGGQKQRLNLLRSLFLNTDILILDEPLNGLDFESITRVLAMLREKQQAGKGILLISHNEEIFDTLVAPERTYYLQAEPAAYKRR